MSDEAQVGGEMVKVSVAYCNSHMASLCCSLLLGASKRLPDGGCFHRAVTGGRCLPSDCAGTNSQGG